MNKGAVMLLCQLSWCVTSALCWWRAYSGWAEYPLFSLWFWGCATVVNLVVLGGAIEKWCGQ